MDTSALQVACNMAKLLLLVVGVTLLSQQTAGMPVADEQTALLQLLSGENSNQEPYKQKLVQQLLEDLYNSGYLGMPEKRLKQGWKIAYGKRARNNAWSIHYGKRNTLPLESDESDKGELAPNSAYSMDMLLSPYSRLTKRQQGWHIAYG